MNSAAQLAANFAIFRSQGIDISPAILLPPMLTSPAKMEGADLLRVSGQYDTKPQRVVFEMAFQAVDNAWRLAGIAVSTVAADPTQPGVRTPVQAPAPTQTPKAPRAGSSTTK